MANRLEKAKAARSRTASAVAEQTRKTAGKATSTNGTPSTLERIALNLPSDVVRAVARQLVDLQDHGRKISTSGFFEAAARALLERDDVEDVLARFGAVARRNPRGQA